jgi:hypothetical protein
MKTLNFDRLIAVLFHLFGHYSPQYSVLLIPKMKKQTPSIKLAFSLYKIKLLKIEMKFTTQFSIDKKA